MDYKLIHASAHDTGIESESIDAVVTSPPYYSLRKYLGDQAIEWPAVEYSPMPGLPALHIEPMRCELGLEPTPEAYIGHLILVMREMWRVLKSTGTAWVNLSDTFAGSGGAHTHDHANPGISKSATRDGVPLNCRREGNGRASDKSGEGLKPKDKMLIPERFRLACQADGWWVRAEIPWVKYNGMPDSCTDRPTITHESLVLLSKSERYFFDMEAVKVPAASSHGSGNGFKRPARLSYQNGDGTARGNEESWEPTDKRFWRTSDVYRDSIAECIRQMRHVVEYGGMVGDTEPAGVIANTRGYSAAHSAVFPENLITPLIKSSTSERGCCPECGSPWERIVERTTEIDESAKGSRFDKGKTGINGAGRTQEGERTRTIAIGWQPTCTCDAGDPVPATVLDPFVGSGTTVQAAIRLGRNAVGVDISQDYLTELVPARIRNTQLVLI